MSFLRNIDDFELIPRVTDAMKEINVSGYLAIEVTNQSVIAKGEVSLAKLEEIHNKMETLLGWEWAYLDAIYYYPYNLYKGYGGEQPGDKIGRDCRKPKPGMLLQVAKDFNINLTSHRW